MIIDLILDRKDSEEWTDGGIYDAHDFYTEVMKYSAIFDGIGDDIPRAMDEGTEMDVRRALCAYIEKNDYNEKIKDYINSRKWITE